MLENVKIKIMLNSRSTRNQTNCWPSWSNALPDTI